MVRGPTPSDAEALEQRLEEWRRDPASVNAIALAEDLAAVGFTAESLEVTTGKAPAGQALGKLALAKQSMGIIEKSRPPKKKKEKKLKPPVEGPVDEDPSITPVPRMTLRAPSGPRAQVAVARRTAKREHKQEARRPRIGLWLGALGLLGAAAAAGVFLLPREEAKAWRMPESVSGRLVLGRPTDFRYAENELSQAHAGAALAALAEQRALALIEYSEGEPARVRAAIAAATEADARTADAGTLAVARAALAVAETGPRPDGPALAVARAEVDRALETTRRDPRAVYLDGVLRARSGDRDGAKAALTEVDAGGAGPVRAGIALADLALDGGEPELALARYEAALARAPGHPRALVGRALARAELRDVQSDAVAGMVSELDAATEQLAGAGALGPRVARAALLLPFDPGAAGAELEAMPVDATRRQLAWTALLRAERGELAEAGRLRARIGDRGDPALVGLLDAELALERGAPEDALAAAGARSDVRARVVRARALLELDRAGEAVVELAAARRVAPTDRRVLSFEAMAKTWAGGADAEAAMTTLVELSAFGGVARYCLAEAELHQGAVEAAARHLREAIPGPLAFRARTRLARLALDAGDPKKLEGVEAELRAALEQAPDHLPARALLGRYLVAVGQPQAALAALNPVASAGRTAAADDVAMAAALAQTGDRARAKEAVRRAVQKGAPREAVREVVKAIDDRALSAELGMP